MCFSATASFAASGGLALLGGASLAVAKKEDRFLAVIPLMFAVQQVFEGIQWTYLDAGSSSLAAGYGFLIFALIVWPIYIPTFVYILDRKKRNILKHLVYLGVSVGFYFFTLLLTRPLHINELMSCVSYDFGAPLDFISGAVYLLAIFVPLFISSHRGLNIFGVAIAVSLVITLLFFSLAYISVWCFFAAAVSSIIFLYIQRKHTPKVGS